MTAVAAACAALAACAGAQRVPPLARGEASVDLEEPAELRRAEDAMWALAVGPERAAARAVISDALAARLARQLATSTALDAGATIERWLGWWHDDPQRLGAELGRHRRLLAALRARFARSGDVEHALAVLVALIEIDPSASAPRTEIEDLLEFTDAGLGASELRGSGSAAALAACLRVIPVRWVVDRYLAIVEARQRAVRELLTRPGVTYRDFHTHRDALLISYNLAAALAHAQRLDELHAHLQALLTLGFNLGMDPELSRLAEEIHRDPGPAAFLGLAKVLRAGPPVAPSRADPRAALAALDSVVERYPGAAALPAAAAEVGESLGRVDQPLARYRAARALAPRDATLPRRIAHLMTAQLTRAATAGRSTRAAQLLDELVAWCEHQRVRDPGGPWPALIAAGQAVVGRALLSHGELGAAVAMLRRALATRDNVEATEALAIALLRSDRHREAAALLQHALAGPALASAEAPTARAQRAELERLLGDAWRGPETRATPAGAAEAAAQHYYECMRQWASLGPSSKLPPALVAPRMLSMARALWWLGNPASSLDLLQQAADAAADDLEIFEGAVAFLLSVDRYADALDLYRQALRFDRGDASLVPMSLWLMAEARHRGREVDAAVLAHLRSRTGRQWHELLAQVAVGRSTLREARRAATTRGRSVELAFYAAALGLEPHHATALLEQVQRAQLVTRFETQLAARYLRALRARR